MQASKPIANLWQTGSAIEESCGPGHCNFAQLGFTLNDSRGVSYSLFDDTLLHG